VQVTQRDKSARKTDRRTRADHALRETLRSRTTRDSAVFEACISGSPA